MQRYSAHFRQYVTCILPPIEISIDSAYRNMPLQLEKLFLLECKDNKIC